MGIRKNQSSLTSAERSAYVSAVKALKASGAYDVFVAEHRAAFLAGPNDPAHGGPAFLPWHREYLRHHRTPYPHVTRIMYYPFQPVAKAGIDTASSIPWRRIVWHHAFWLHRPPAG